MRVTIAAECPHCETTYQVAPDLAGKSMRCPNTDCREVFTVGAAGPIGTPNPTPTDDELLVLDDEPESTAVPPARSVPVAAPAARPAVPLPAASLPPTHGPREVVWAGHDAPPPPPAAPGPPTAIPAPTDDLPFVRRRRKSPWPKRILLSFVFVLFALGGAGGFAYFRYVAQTEDRARAEAETSYQANNFGTAEKQFESLVETYPSSGDVDEYRFFARLSAVRAAVGSVTARSEPGPALDRLRAFLTEFGDSSLAQPGTGYGSDVVAAGQQMADALVHHAQDRLDDSQAEARRVDDDWSTHLARQRTDPAAADLIAAEQTVADGEALLPTLDRYREKDGLNFDDQKAKFADLRAQFTAERARTAAIAGWRDLPADPTDLKIESFSRSMRTAGLSDDPEVGQLTAWAESELRARIVGTVGFRPAEPPPAEVSPPVLVSAAVAGSPVPLTSADAPPDVVFALARGVLYALDAHDGKRLWGQQVADATADTRGTDLPVRFTLADGRTDWVIVPATVAGRTGLTARNARSGEPVWHQPLEAGLAGRPLILGRRVYVPLADAVGTVVEFQATTGDRVGHLTIRQRVGASLVGTDGPTPGTYRLFVPADARRVFEFRVGAESADGTPEPPRLTRDIPTGHPRDALTGTVLLVGRTDDGSPLYLLMTLADGQATMTVRAYALDRGDPPPTADVTVPGWSSFPAATNGERVVVATDAGTYAVLGVNQAGNADRAIFPLAGPGPVADQTDLKPSLVVDVNEDAAWVVLDKELVRLRTAVDPARGLRVVRHGRAVTVGDPVHRGQTRPRLGLGVVVTRTAGAVHVTGFDLSTGAVRWQQQLGAVGTLLRVETGPTLLIGENGGVFDADTATTLAAPVPNPAGRAIAVADGPTVWGLVPVTSTAGDRLHIRELERAGDSVRRVGETSMALPASPAGTPVVVAGAVVLPLADGFLYRFIRGTSGLERGLRWRGTEADPDSTCAIAAVDGDRFLVTDGVRTITLAGVAECRPPAGRPDRRLGIAGRCDPRPDRAAGRDSPLRGRRPDGRRVLVRRGHHVRPGPPLARLGRWRDSGRPARRPTRRVPPCVIERTCYMRSTAARWSAWMSNNRGRPGKPRRRRCLRDSNSSAGRSTPGTSSRPIRPAG